MAANWMDPIALEEKLTKEVVPSADIDSHAGRRAQTLVLMLQVVRMREQVHETQRLARSTFWMAAFVAVASLAQVLTVALAFSR